MTDKIEFTGDCRFDTYGAGIRPKGYGLQCSPIVLGEDFIIASRTLVKGVTKPSHLGL